MSWPKVALGEVVNFLGGGTPSKNNPKYWGGTIPWATVKDIKGPSLDRTIDSITEEGVKNSATRLVPAGTVILPTRMALGKAAIATLPVAINQDLKAAIPNASLNPRYLLHFLHFASDQIQRLGAGATVQGVTVDRLSRLEIPLPPLDAQRRIASVLDKADALRHQRQVSIGLTEKLLHSVFIDMFGDPVRNSKNLPVDDLSHLAKLERGKFTPRPRNDPSYFGGAYPFIQTGDITRSKGRITSWTQTLNDKGASVSKEFGAGTVVIAIVGATLGETAIVETPVYCPDSIIGITPFRDKATPEFIEFLLRLWKPRLKELAPDAARANLNLERLRPLQAVAPGLEEQEAFSRIAKHLRTLALGQKESDLQLTVLYSAIEQRAFRGDLDLSRLELDSELEIYPHAIAHEHPVSHGRYNRPGIFIAPAEIEAQMLALEDELNYGPGDSIPWSENFFKYRILSQVLKPPFSFAEIWDKVRYDMEDASYEAVKAKVFEYVEAGILEQGFDRERKEIVFRPRA